MEILLCFYLLFYCLLEQHSLQEVGGIYMASFKLCISEKGTSYQKEVKVSNETIKTVRNETWKTYTAKLGECVKTQTASSSPSTVLNLEDGGSSDTSAQL